MDPLCARRIIDLLFDWFGLFCFANKKIVNCHTADSKPVKQEINGTVILPPLVFPGKTIKFKSVHFAIHVNVLHTITNVHAYNERANFGIAIYYRGRH
jgi:hypothetical protein